jgi:hypothetical protein
LGAVPVPNFCARLRHFATVQTHEKVEERSQVVDLLEKMLKPVHDEEIRFLNEVKDTLTDPQERANYDAGQAQSQSSAAFGRGLDDFLNQVLGSHATGCFTFNSNGGFAQNKPRTSNHPKAAEGRVAEAVRSAVAETEARLREDIRMHDVHAKNLLAQVQQFKEEAAISQSRILDAEQQAWDARAQMQREQFQTAEMIAQLQDQNQMLQGQLFSIQATAASEATIAQLQHQVQLLQGQLLSVQVSHRQLQMRSEFESLQLLRGKRSVKRN